MVIGDRFHSSNLRKSLIERVAHLEVPVIILFFPPYPFSLDNVSFTFLFYLGSTGPIRCLSTNPHSWNDIYYQSESQRSESSMQHLLGRWMGQF